MIKKRLELLEQLQEIDVLIDSLKVSQNGLIEEMADISKAAEIARQELQELEERVALLEKERAETDACHATELDNIRRSETNMKEIKTNKEFQAIGREISAAKKLVTELEESSLQKLAQIEELQADIAAKKELLGELELNTSGHCAEKQAEIDRIQQDVDADNARREAIAAELPVTLTKRYVSLRSQRRGIAVAGARDGYCLGCNMNLPPQLYNSLFKAEEMISCPHCQRILVLRQQPQVP